MNPITRYYICLVLLICQAGGITAKDGRVVRRPDYILVQLSTEQNRMRILEANGDRKGIERLKKDLSSVYSAIRNDFQDHFNFCPVYFFFDTSTALIKLHQFDGVVYSIKGSPLPAGYLKGDNFQVVYFGYPVVRIPRVGYLPESADKASFNTTFGRVWVVCDKDFEQVGYSELPRYFDRSMEYYFEREYRYHSRKFDIEYNPIVNKLEQVFSEMAPK